MKYKVGDKVVVDYKLWFPEREYYTVATNFDGDIYHFREIPYVAEEKRIAGYYNPFNIYLKLL